MENKQKLGFLSLVLTSLILAGCSGPETTPEDDNNNVNNSASEQTTQVTPLADDSKIEENNVVTDKLEEVKELVTVYYFDFDQASLSSDTRKALNVVAAALKASGDNVRLEGHADERGTREYNLALGERRAKAVANYLRVQGVKSSQLEVISYGEEKPAVRGNSEADMAKNRRVQLVR